MAEITGWKTRAASSFDQPRNWHQMVMNRPASPVMPPSTPLSTPTPRSAATLAARTGLTVRPHQEIAAVGDEQQADAEAQIARVGIMDSSMAPIGTPTSAAEDERRHGAPAQGVPQPPDAVALHDQAVADDQDGGLRRRQDVQPDAGDHQAHGKAGKARDNAAEKCRLPGKVLEPGHPWVARRNDVTSAWMDGCHLGGEAAISPANQLYHATTAKQSAWGARGHMSNKIDLSGRNARRHRRRAGHRPRHRRALSRFRRRGRDLGSRFALAKKTAGGTAASAARSPPSPSMSPISPMSSARATRR